MPNDLKDDKIYPLYNVGDYSREIKYRLQRSHILGKRLLQKTRNITKIFYEKFVKPCNLTISDKFYVKKEPYDEFKNIYEGILLKVLLVLM